MNESSFLEYSSLFRSYLPLNKLDITAYYHSNAPRQLKSRPASQIEREVRLQKILSDALQNQKSSKDVSLCSDCLIDLDKSSKKAQEEVAASLKRHGDFYRALQPKPLRRRSGQRVDKSEEEVAGRLVPLPSVPDHARKSARRAALLRQEVCDLRDQLRRTSETCSSTCAQLIKIEKERHGVPSLACLESENHALSEELEDCLAMLHRARRESELLSSRPDSSKLAPADASRVTLYSLCPLHDLLLVDAERRYAVVDSLRMAAVPQPTLQLNYREINMGFSALAGYLLHLQRLLGMDHLQTWVKEEGAHYRIELLPLFDRVVVTVKKLFASPAKDERALKEEKLFLEAGVVLSSCSEDLEPALSPNAKHTRPVDTVQKHFCRSLYALIVSLLLLILRALDMNVFIKEASLKDKGLCARLGRLRNYFRDSPSHQQEQSRAEDDDYKEVLFRICLGLIAGAPIGFENEALYEAKEEEDEDYVFTESVLAGPALPCSPTAAEEQEQPRLIMAWNKMKSELKAHRCVLGSHLSDARHGHFLLMEALACCRRVFR
eukprot:gene9319-10287_t